MAATTFQISAIDAMMRFLSSVTPLSYAATEALASCMVLERYPRRHVLQHQNRQATHLYIISSGMVRCFWQEEDKEVTVDFGMEQCVLYAMDSLLSKGAASYSIETLEESEIISIPFSDLEALYNDFHEIERMGRLLVSRYYMEQEAWLRSARFKSAEERYRELETTNPALLQRAPLGYLASYLGITQATLSRIRGKY